MNSVVLDSPAVNRVQAAAAKDTIWNAGDIPAGNIPFTSGYLITHDYHTLSSYQI